MTEQAPSLILTVSHADAGKRLDAFLAENIDGWSRSRLRRLIDDGDVLVNSAETKPSYKVREGDELDVELVEIPSASFEPEDIPLDVVFEDEHIAVINKPAGMVVHPGAGINSGTLANAVAFHWSRRTRTGVSSGSDRVGIVHRLDKDTSGLIVVAKDDETHEALANQFRDRTVRKKYIALVHGNPRENSGSIDRPIARDRWHRTKMTVAANGRHALTLWAVKQRFEKFALLDVDIKTGRTHQIRVHLASINHPVVGDSVYNEGRDKTIADVTIRNAVGSLGRFFLHSAALSFKDPVSGRELSFESPLPKELEELLLLLR